MVGEKHWVFIFCKKLYQVQRGRIVRYVFHDDKIFIRRENKPNNAQSCQDIGEPQVLKSREIRKSTEARWISQAASFRGVMKIPPTYTLFPTLFSCKQGCGSGSAWIRIRNYSSGSRSSKKWKSIQIKLWILDCLYYWTVVSNGEWQIVVKILLFVLFRNILN